jgi:DNA-directed RNA polymerase subunit E'/Rpb7
MATMDKTKGKRGKNKYEYQERLYIRNLLEMNVILYPNEIGQNKTRQNLQDSISQKIGGKCIEEGYVQPGSIDVKQYSSGLVKGDTVEFHVVFQCYTSNPVEGTNIECTIKSITKAGIHAEAHDNKGYMPVTVFVARDQFVESPLFQKYTEDSIGQNITIKVIGTRFELNDECVEVLGELIDV